MRFWHVANNNIVSVVYTLMLVKDGKHRDTIGTKCTNPILIEAVKFVYVNTEKYTIPTTFQ